MISEFPEFTTWTLWADRAKIADADACCGVYLLAQFRVEPASTIDVDALDESIVRIGETHARTFLERWGSKGNDWQSVFNRDGGVPPCLYVTASRVEPHRTVEVEQLLTGRYIERHGRRPAWHTNDGWAGRFQPFDTI